MNEPSRLARLFCQRVLLTSTGISSLFNVAKIIYTCTLACQRDLLRCLTWSSQLGPAPGPASGPAPGPASGSAPSARLVSYWPSRQWFNTWSELGQHLQGIGYFGLHFQRIGYFGHPLQPARRLVNYVWSTALSVSHIQYLHTPTQARRGTGLRR